MSRVNVVAKLKVSDLDLYRSRQGFTSFRAIENGERSNPSLDVLRLFICTPKFSESIKTHRVDHV